MALNSLEAATEGLIRTDGRNSLTLATRGLIKVAGAVAAQKFIGFVTNISSLMNR